MHFLTFAYKQTYATVVNKWRETRVWRYQLKG